MSFNVQPNTHQLPKLPISEVLEDIKHQLSEHQQLVLEAPPGAGKTTLVPLSLLNEIWLGQQRIIMLEPRRMAARAAAERMASLLNEPVGQTVGYRVRQQTKISKHTRIEVITEGILGRMLMQDPSLEGVGLLIFDEFHERSLDADTGLALTLQSRDIFREAESPLRLMIMSATLNGEKTASLLESPTNPTAPIIRSAGKMYPVDIIYGNTKRFDEDITSTMANTIVQITEQHEGNLLAFLPGQREINRVLQKLKQQLPTSQQENTLILPLFGALSISEQQRAIQPLPETASKRKIVLATDIAETSLTIEGVTIVVDSGLCREPRFDPSTGMSRLHTIRISKDSSVQRMGRAGRLTSGYCYRLWSEEQQHQLSPHSIPEIQQADLTPLALQLLAWGVDDINELKWLDLPPTGPMQQALELLFKLGATVQKNKDFGNIGQSSLEDWRLTSHGEKMAAIPAHPRLAHMLLISLQHSLQNAASALAALLMDRSPLFHEFGPDLSLHIAVVQGEQRCSQQHRNWLKRTQQQARNLLKLLEPYADINKPKTLIKNEKDAPGFLIANAYPDRIAQHKLNSKNHYALSNGRNASIDPGSSLSNQPWLAVAELGGSINQQGKKNNDVIYSACNFEPALLDSALLALTDTQNTLQWNDQTERFSAEKIHRVGKIIINRTPCNNIPVAAKQSALIDLLKKRGLQLLPWNDAIRQWQARVMLLDTINSENSQNPWPDVSDENLLATLEQWLGPYLQPVYKLDDFKQLDLQKILSNLLPWPLPEQLNEWAPVSISVPSGSKLSIDYSKSPPVLKVKLQEMFGCEHTPSIVGGKVKLMLHLLSPARRPLQVTQDLSGFWKSSYFDVKKEMKGRYPKHPWPDDPLQAPPTRHTKKRSGQ